MKFFGSQNNAHKAGRYKIIICVDLPDDDDGSRGARGLKGKRPKTGSAMTLANVVDNTFSLAMLLLNRMHYLMPGSPMHSGPVSDRFMTSRHALAC